MSDKSREALLALGIEALVRASIDLGWDAREMGVPKIQAKAEAWQESRDKVRQMVANILTAERPDRTCNAPDCTKTPGHIGAHE